MKTLALILPYANSIVDFRGALIREIVSRRHRVVVLAPDFDTKTREAVQGLGAETLDYPLARTGMNPWRDLKSLLALGQQLAAVRPNVCLSCAIKPVIYGTLAATLAQVPHRVALIEGLGFAFTDNGLPLGVKRRLLRHVVSMLYRLALKRAHRVLMLNPDDMQEFAQRGLVAPGQARCIGGIGVNLAEWPVTPTPTLRDYPVTFALAARLLREKGVLEYVAAARIIKARYPRTRFLLLGGLDENPGAITLEDVQSWVQEGAVEWPGHVAMSPWLAKAHVYVLPSYREGVPRSTQEAMAMGRPIITTDVPGCRETVVNEDNGFLVPPRNVDALVKAMERFICDPDLIPRMGARSRQIAEDKFDVHKVNAVMLRELGLE